MQLVINKNYWGSTWISCCSHGYDRIADKDHLVEEKSALAHSWTVQSVMPGWVWGQQLVPHSLETLTAACSCSAPVLVLFSRTTAHGRVLLTLRMAVSLTQLAQPRNSSTDMPHVL